MVEESKLVQKQKKEERKRSMMKLNGLFVEGFMSFLQGMMLGFNMDIDDFEDDGEIESSELRQFINRNLYKRIDEDSDSDEDVPGDHIAFRDETGFFAGLKSMLDDEEEEVNFFDILKLLGGLKGDIKKLLPGMDGCSDDQDTGRSETYVPSVFNYDKDVAVSQFNSNHDPTIDHPSNIGQNLLIQLENEASIQFTSAFPNACYCYLNY